MLEPSYLVRLNSKPEDENSDPEDEWASDVLVAEVGEDGEMRVREESARVLCADRVSHYGHVDALDGEPGYVMWDGETRYFVHEQDVERVSEFKEVEL